MGRQMEDAVAAAELLEGALGGARPGEDPPGRRQMTLEALDLPGREAQARSLGRQGQQGARGGLARSAGGQVCRRG